LLVARAVEGTRGALRHAAGRAHHLAEQHQLRWRVLRAAALEDVAPGVLGARQHLGDELRPLVLRRTRLSRGAGLRVAAVRRLGREASAAGLLQEGHRVGTEQPGADDDQQDSAESDAQAAAGNAESATACPALVLDVLALATFPPTHRVPSARGPPVLRSPSISQCPHPSISPRSRFAPFRSSASRAQGSAIQRGRWTASLTRSKRTRTRVPISIERGSTSFKAPPGRLTRFPTSRTRGSSSSATTTTL